jgi:penicillin amidase
VLHDLLAHLGGVDARPFFPDEDAALPGPAGAPLTAGSWGDPLRRALGLAGASAGSTAFVVAGRYTASGRPLLGADLHVEPTAPLLLHVAHVRAGALDVAGAMIPGLPIVWSGHNRRVAWGATHARAVVTDLYTERVNLEESRYHDGQRWRRLEERDESIAVRGAETVAHRVRATHHGPLLEDLADDREPLALGWVGQRGQGGRTLAAWLAALRAEDAPAFRAALAGVSEPAVAVVYADWEGRGGVQVAGWIPRRTLASDLVPVPGRARWYDWEGPIPYERLPGARLDEKTVVLVAADNPQPGPAAERGEWLWRSGVRARRLRDQLGAALGRGPLDLDGVEALQADVGEPRSQALSLAALALVHDESLGREAAEVAELLQDWDGRADAESVGASAHHAFTLALLHRLFEERMGRELFDRWLALPHVDHAAILLGVIERARAGGRDVWSEPQGVRAAVHGALRDAWFQLSSQLGASRRKWSWGRLHRLRFRPFLPARSLAGLGPLEAAGSGVTLATAEFAPDAPFDVRMASLFRVAIDTASFGRARVLIAPGQSEHPGHPDHAKGLSAWSLGRGVPLETGLDALGTAAVARLQLEPAP